MYCTFAGHLSLLLCHLPGRLYLADFRRPRYGLPIGTQGPAGVEDVNMSNPLGGGSSYLAGGSLLPPGADIFAAVLSPQAYTDTLHHDQLLHHHQHLHNSSLGPGSALSQIS